MGAYIDPHGGHDWDEPDAKETWLQQHAELLQRKPRWCDISKDKLPVCLLANEGQFSMAGIAYNERELRRLAESLDDRHSWWLASENELLDPRVSTLCRYRNQIEERP